MNQALFVGACVVMAPIAAAASTDWPANAPLIRPQPDGVIVLNAEAAAFVMDDKSGRHVLNEVDPQIVIRDGLLTRVGNRYQFPAWRFQAPEAGHKYRVIANVNLEQIEPLSLSVSFVAGKSEGRAAKSLTRTPPGTGVQPVEIGVTGLAPGELEARVVITGRHMGRLPDIQDIRLVPQTNTAPDAPTRPYPKVVYPTPAALAAPPLYPTGNLDRLPQMPSRDIPEEALVVVPPPVDADSRRAAFAARTSDAAIEDLARRLERALVPGTKGLEPFASAMKHGRFREALEAYRGYFFAKLKDPAAYGAGAAELRMDFFQKDGKRRYINQPDPKELERNRRGIIQRYVLGPPGAVNWAPLSLVPPEGARFERVADRHPFWKTPEGRARGEDINFFRSLTRVNHDFGGSLFQDLLLAYLMTGDRASLRLYADYMEDWAMHVDNDIDNHPLNMRSAFEYQAIGGYLARLRVILDERPTLADDFPAPALARIMLNLTEMYHPYTVRAKRAELANWGIMGLASVIRDSLLMHEFHAMQYMNREAARLVRINWIQHVGLDGECLEAWDEGHMAIDGMLAPGRFMSLCGAPVMGPLEQQTVVDHHKVMQRAILTHYTPDGNYWSCWLPYNDAARATIHGKILTRQLIDDVYDEPVVRHRMDAVLARAEADREPPLSDLQPYGALVMLRDGFGGDSSSLVMQNFPMRSQTQGITTNGKRGHVLGSMRTQFGVARGDRGLLEASAIVVDGKPPHRWVDATPSGGKTDYCMQTPRNVQPGRFHTSARFDVAETMQDSPYSGYQFSTYPEMMGLHTTAPDAVIRDVQATRIAFQLRGQGVFLIADRIRNPGPEREYAKFFVLPTYGFAATNLAARESPPAVRLASLEALAAKSAVLLDVDASRHRVRTGNPGFQNVSVHSAGHAYTWGGTQRRPGDIAPPASVTAADMLTAARKATDLERFFDSSIFRVVSARWKAAGPQADITVVATRPDDVEGQGTFAPDLSEFDDTSADGVASCRFTCVDGTVVALGVSPDGARPLAAGPVRADAGTLLVMQKGDALAGIVLDGDAVMIDGKRHAGPGAAFEFSFDKARVFEATPIHTAIDTTVIEPPQTVFTDSVDVRFTIPTQNTSDIEFRYTLDGSDPTLASAVYDRPFTIDSDTLVKVRPFRKRLTETPWNIAGVDAGKTVWAVFRKQAPLKAEPERAREPGLAFRYFEGPWPQLMSLSAPLSILEPRAQGACDRLLDEEHLATIRLTDRAYQVKYSGYLTVPKTGVYRFHAPEHLYNTTMDSGFDLRVWVGGQEWFPNPDLHCENVWCVSLEKGSHRFEVSYTDYRWKTFRNEYSMAWREEQVWNGTPRVMTDGPGLGLQPLPAAWLSREEK
jgi:hypothetical protein